MGDIDYILDIRRNRHHLGELANAVSIVPFVGAGMSSDFFPMWREFLDQFDLLSEEKKHLHQFLDKGEFEEAASYIFSISKRLFIDTVKDVFSSAHFEGKEFNPSLKILPQISDSMVLTTNLDEVLENVWHCTGNKFDAVITPDCEDLFHDAIKNKGKTLVKLHGTVEESSKYVLTKEQYDKAYGISFEDVVDFSNPFPQNLSLAIYAKTILFLGCSLQSDRFLHVFKQIAQLNDHIKHYALLSLSNKDDENTLCERKLERYGIFPIWFPNGDYGSITTILYELMRLKKTLKLNDTVNTLPRDLAGMYGRDIDSIVSSILKKGSNSNTVVITSFDGMPAVGKTVLAVKIAHILSSKYYDAQLFIDCYGYTAGHEPLGKEQILDSLLFASGIASARIPEKYEDKLSLWRYELHDKSLIIVFDNVKYEQQIDEIIPSSTNSLFIITSRNRLMINDCKSIAVDVLDEDASVMILNGGVPEDNKIRYELLVKLAAKYGNLPLALHIISYQIQGKSCKYIQRLLNDDNKLENLNAISDAVYLSFDVSYECLHRQEQQLFQILGLFPGYDFTPGECAAMLGESTYSVYKYLDVLYQQHLIKEVGEESYVLHDLMRDFSREKYHLNNNDNSLPLVRLSQYYVEYIIHCNTYLYPYNYSEYIDSEFVKDIDDLPSNTYDALEWLRLKLENVMACLNVAKLNNWHTLYFKLSYVLSQYLIKRLSGWRVVKIYQEVVSYNDIDNWMKAASITNLARAHHQVGNFNTAVMFFVSAEESWKTIGNWKALANTLGHHAFTLERLGQYVNALTITDEALKLYNEISDLSGIANVLNIRGAVYWRMKKYVVAKKFFENAINIRKNIGDEYGASNSINNLAFTFLKLRNAGEARKGFLTSLELSRKYQDYSGEAVTLNNLGYTEIFSENPNMAVDYATSAFMISKRTGDEYQEARSYDVKAQAYILLCNTDEAIVYFEKALSLFEKLDVPEAEEVKCSLDALL